jgi:hypothetical protein
MATRREKSAWSDIATISIALLSLFLAIWSGMATREHDELSSLPKLSFSIEMNSFDDGIYIENLGPGVAVIKSASISYASKTVNDEDLDSLLTSDDSLIDISQARHFNFLKGRFVKPGEREDILMTKLGNIKNITRFKNMIERNLIFTYEYCSIYGDCWKVCSVIATNCGEETPADQILGRSSFWRIL